MGESIEIDSVIESQYRCIDTDKICSRENCPYPVPDDFKPGILAESTRQAMVLNLMVALKMPVADLNKLTDTQLMDVSNYVADLKLKGDETDDI